MKKAAYRIEGLDCAEEVAILRKEVGGLDGVGRLDFDILNAKMTVEFDPGKVGDDGIVAAVAAGGMKAFPWVLSRAGEQESFWAANGRLIMACASAAFLVAGVLTHWRIHGNILHVLDIGKPPVGHTYPLPVILIYVAALVTGGWFVAPKALASARALRPDMNLLMAIAVIGAMSIGEWLEAGMVAFLFSVALLLEHWSVGRARRAISALMDLSPKVARCRVPETDEIIERPVEQVHVGAIVVVRPGEKIPLDGRVTQGRASVNQAPITGESVPVEKELGDDVFAGTINEDGALEFTATRAAEDTTLARIVRMVSEAQSRRARSERWVEKFARIYTPCMIALAAAIALLPPLMVGHWAQWLYRALVILVIACPCALVISTPVSIVSGLTAAARRGVLIKGGIHLEMVGHLDALAFDKTGTLTYGRPEVQEIVAFQGHSRDEVLARAAALESHSAHPLARAILREAASEEISADRADDYRAIHGEGAEGRVFGRPFWIGSHRMMDTKGQETPESHQRATELADAGHSVVALGNDEHVCGLISVSDRVRENAAESVAALKAAGIRRTVMLTGDNEATAAAVAKAAGVEEFRAELLPQDKVAAVESLVEEYEHVGMVGDGVNDAPAMAAATVGIAMGAAGTDAAIETADIALMSDDLSKLAWLIRHSQRTVRVIRQNIFFAIGLKFAFMALAVLGIATLWMAIAADMGASLLVIFNGLRLLRARG